MVIFFFCPKIYSLNKSNLIWAEGIRDLSSFKAIEFHKVWEVYLEENFIGFTRKFSLKSEGDRVRISLFPFLFRWKYQIIRVFPSFLLPRLSFRPFYPFIPPFLCPFAWFLRSQQSLLSVCPFHLFTDTSLLCICQIYPLITTSPQTLYPIHPLTIYLSVASIHNRLFFSVLIAIKRWPQNLSDLPLHHRS